MSTKLRGPSLDISRHQIEEELRRAQNTVCRVAMETMLYVLENDLDLAAMLPWTDHDMSGRDAFLERVRNVRGLVRRGRYR